MFTKILKDLKEVEMSYEEIFDTNKYNIFKGVTYVSSVSFIDEVVNKFIDSELIIGINDSNYLKNMNEMKILHQRHMKQFYTHFCLLIYIY